MQCSSGAFLGPGDAFTMALLFWDVERDVREFGFAVRSGEGHLLYRCRVAMEKDREWRHEQCEC
jgi:hypothetical protein